MRWCPVERVVEVEGEGVVVGFGEVFMRLA
jgi:hypothetical protein